MHRLLLLCSLTLSLATIGLGDSVALHQQALRVQRGTGSAATTPPEATELLANSAIVAATRLDGPKAVAALKLAMRKVDHLEMPSALELGGSRKPEVLQNIASSFSTLLNATEATWLLSSDELADIERRFHRKALNQLAPALQSGRHSASPGFWQQFWAQAKHTFVKAIFHDDKSVMKTVAADSEDLTSIEEVVKPPKFIKRREGERAFTVVTGSCTVDVSGCLLSPNYPSNYTNRETCIIAVNKSMAGPINVTHFDTEVMADILIVNGVRYSGTAGPEGVWPQEDIVWFSDYVLGGMGFSLCPTPPSSEVPDSPVHVRTNLTVAKGTCTVDSRGCAMSSNYPQSYPDDDYCIINVNEGAETPLHVEDFSTEKVYDVLSVNGKNFSGDEGPEGLVPRGQIIWSADYSYFSTGWKVCPQGSNSARGEANNSVFTVRVGDCTVGPDGCVQSPLYPAVYPNSGVCTIGVNTSAAGPLRTERFLTELGYDVLTVNGLHFSGTRGPDGVVPYEDLLWFSDFQAASSGWKICSGPKPPPQEEPTEQDAAPNFTLVEGSCIIEEQCAKSPNYPHRYGNNEHCVINVSASNEVPLRVADFSTEYQLDALVINGKPFSGITGPDGVVPHGRIEWSSDIDVRAGGWKICFMSLTPSAETTTTTTTTTTTSTTTSTTTNTTTTATTTTTTTSTTAAALEPSPWEDLAYHMEVSRAMVDSLFVLQEKAQLFDQSASLFRKALQALTSQKPSMQSPLEWHVHFINGSMAGTLGPWVHFTRALKPAFASLLQAVTSQNHTHSFFFKSHLDIDAQADMFQRKVVWFAVEMVRQHVSLLEQTPEVLPSKLEAIKVPVRTFRTELNEFLEYAFADFNAVPSFFQNQIKDPIQYVGLGFCLDSEGMQYDTLESKGCDTVFWCSSSCRRFDACRGFTMSYAKEENHICARCELRVEEGFAASTPFWKYTWTNGTGRGPVAAAAGRTSGGAFPHCFGRQPYNTTGWTPRMRAAVEAEQAKQMEKYESASEAWTDIIATLKGAFWKIMSSIEDATSKAVAAELEAHQKSVTA